MTSFNFTDYHFNSIELTLNQYINSSFPSPYPIYEYTESDIKNFVNILFRVNQECYSLIGCSNVRLMREDANGRLLTHSELIKALYSLEYEYEIQEIGLVRQLTQEEIKTKEILHQMLHSLMLDYMNRLEAFKSLAWIIKPDDLSSLTVNIYSDEEALFIH